MNSVKTITINGLTGVLHQNNNDKILIVLPGAASALGWNKEHYLWEIVSDKVDLFVINYLGHSISSGEFSVTNCLLSLRMAVNFARGKLKARELMTTEDFSVQYKTIVALGSSFGGTILANGLDLDIDKFVFIQADTAPHLDPEWVNNDFMRELREYKEVYRWKSLKEFEDLIAGKKYNPLRYQNHINLQKSVVIIHGTQDEIIPIDIAENYFKYLQDNNYSNVKFIKLEGLGHSSDTTAHAFRENREEIFGT